MHPILKASRKILTFKYYDKFAFIQIRDSMGAHLIFFIIFPLFSCIILTNQSLPWYSLRSGFQCDTKMAAVFSCMRPLATGQSILLGPICRTYTPPTYALYCTFTCLTVIRDWSLITGRGRGDKMGKSRVRNFLRPPLKTG